MLRVAQLLFTETNRLKHGGIDAEGIDQGSADGFGTPLAEIHIVFAPAHCIGMADNKEAIAEENRIMQRVGNRTDIPIQFRTDDGGAKIEVNLDGELGKIGNIQGNEIG